MTIHQFPCLADNYGLLLHDEATGATAAIDAPDAGAILAALAEKGWRLTHILLTHHHPDHVDGAPALKAATGCRIAGPRADASRLPPLDTPVEDGDTVLIGETAVPVIATPGHTSGHVIYWCPAEGAAFVGDTLFSLGCGRVMEGTPETMWQSLRKILALPPETQIYCGHEYTLANARFALTVEPGNPALRARADAAAALRAEGRPTLPARLADERAANPFLRPDSPEIRRTLGLEDAPDWQVFAELRARKNRS